MAAAQPVEARPSRGGVAAHVRPVVSVDVGAGAASVGNHESPRLALSAAGPPHWRNGRILPYAAGAAVAMLAAGGAWLMTPRDASRVPPPPARAGAAPPGNAASVTAVPPVPVAVPERNIQVALPVPGPETCADPEVASRLRAALAKALPRPDPKARDKAATIAMIGKGRVKLADPAGALTICTAGLVMRRAGKSSVVDVDYAVEAAAGGVARVVPIGFDNSLKRLDASDPGQTNEPAKPARSGSVAPPVSRADAAAPSSRKAAEVTDNSAGNRLSTPATADTRFGSAPRDAALPMTSGSRAPFAGTALVETDDASPATARKPAGCEQPPTLSVSITCGSRTLLALNARVTASVAALATPRNAARLALVKRHADRHFDRCTTASCVGQAYRYWFAELAKIDRDGANAESGGNPKPSG